MAKLSLEEFSKQVNLLASKRAGRANELHRQGKTLFGSKHYDYPESMLSYYWESGKTPKQSEQEIRTSR